MGHGPKESPKPMEPGAAAPDMSGKVRISVCFSQLSNAK